MFVVIHILLFYYSHLIVSFQSDVVPYPSFKVIIILLFQIKFKKTNFYYFSAVFAVKRCRPGKAVQMSEQEVRGLCLKSREIFLAQPILLELEAPLSICGNLPVKLAIGSIEAFCLSVFYNCITFSLSFVTR